MRQHASRDLGEHDVGLDYRESKAPHSLVAEIGSDLVDAGAPDVEVDEA